MNINQRLRSSENNRIGKEILHKNMTFVIAGYMDIQDEHKVFP
jgi:hypothetical protein